MQISPFIIKEINEFVEVSIGYLLKRNAENVAYFKCQNQCFLCALIVKKRMNHELQSISVIGKMTGSQHLQKLHHAS